MSKATKKPIVAESVPTPSRRHTTMVYVGEIDDTRRSAVMRPPSRPAHALPTLADYGLKARGELPGESWVKCWQQERAYTMGFRAGLHGGPAALLERWYETDEERRAAWVLGCNDGARVRERRASK